MNKRLTKRLLILALLASPLLVQAQRGHAAAGHGGRASTQPGSFQPGRIAGTNPLYNRQAYSNFYGTDGYGYGNRYGNNFYGPRNGTILGPGFGGYSQPSAQFGDQPAIQTFTPAPVQAAAGEYIPSYMRTDSGPSLGEIARGLRTEHKAAVLVWGNWELKPAPVKQNE